MRRKELNHNGPFGFGIFEITHERLPTFGMTETVCRNEFRPEDIWLTVFHDVRTKNSVRDIGKWRQNENRLFRFFPESEERLGHILSITGKV